MKPAPSPSMSIPAVVLKSASGRCAALGIIRSLGRLGVSVFLASNSSKSPPARSRYLRGLEALGPDREEWPTQLARIGKRLERPVLIPTDDVAALLVDSNAELLRDTFRFPSSPLGLFPRLSNKFSLHELCSEFGIPTPRVAVPSSPSELQEFLRTASLPIVAKSIDPRIMLGRGDPSVQLLHHREEAERFGRDLFASGGEPNFLFQEYIPGGPESIWMFNGYFDEDSRCLFGATGRKLHQYPPYTGMTSLGLCEPNDAVGRTTMDLMHRIGYRGILDIGYRYDRRDGLYKLLDVNPRIGATFRLFVGQGGMDVARAMYLDLTGHSVPDDRCPPGRRWLVETTYPASTLAYLRDGEIDVKTAARSLRGLREAAFFAADDPLPAVTAYARTLGTRVRRLARSTRVAPQPPQVAT
jgi:D-aspartate ligase